MRNEGKRCESLCLLAVNMHQTVTDMYNEMQLGMYSQTSKYGHEHVIMCHVILLFLNRGQYHLSPDTADYNIIMRNCLFKTVGVSTIHL